MDFYEDLHRIGAKEGLKGRKMQKAMESFAWSITVLKKLQTSLFLTLLFSLACDTQTVPDCCRQKTCSCRIYDLLHGTGNHAAGILTLGKRKTDGQAYQSRLYRLLHASGNHAAGILTMGKRGEAGSIQSPDNSMVNQMCPSPPSVLDHYSSSDSM
ncbi:UNVERIFIED_CONTAM: hypothetical protein FKN15_000531 [Acipenser sinensis]